MVDIGKVLVNIKAIMYMSTHTQRISKMCAQNRLIIQNTKEKKVDFYRVSSAKAIGFVWSSWALNFMDSAGTRKHPLKDQLCSSGPFEGLCSNNITKIYPVYLCIFADG